MIHDAEQSLLLYEAETAAVSWSTLSMMEDLAFGA